MQELTKNFKQGLQSLKSILLKLKKYPGNATYSSEYQKSRLNSDKQKKTLLKALDALDENPALEEIKTRITNEYSLFKEKANYADKIKAIKALNDLLDELELELHEIHIPANILPAELEQKLGTAFQKEIQALKLVYGRSGDCSAFIIRKILEKAIFFAFSKNELSYKIEDKSNPNKFQNLNSMIKTASAEKINGKPILYAKTASKILGIKFLGDSSAHNFLVNIDMEDITPQMPYIVIALKELASHFNH